MRVALAIVIELPDDENDPFDDGLDLNWLLGPDGVDRCSVAEILAAVTSRDSLSYDLEYVSHELLPELDGRPPEVIDG